MKHQSGSLAAWKTRREEYRKRSGPVSNPGDGRPRKKERRHAKAPERIEARMLRLYLAAWDEALGMNNRGER